MQKYKAEDTQNYNFTCNLYGCETRSPTFTEKRRLRVFENRVLRRIFGPTRDEVTGVWRKIHKDELNDGEEESRIRGFGGET
jgi:flagellar motor switch protein FliM